MTHRYITTPEGPALLLAGLEGTQVYIPRDVSIYLDAQDSADEEEGPMPCFFFDVRFPAHELCAVRRGQVKYQGRDYYADALQSRDAESVKVRPDTTPGVVAVHTTGGDFICFAQVCADVPDYFPQATLDAARERRIKGIVQRRQAQRDQALSGAPDGAAHPAPPPPPADQIAGLQAGLQRVTDAVELLQMAVLSLLEARQPQR